ncbi:unnamed protein product [Kluyveromyces dobzhanskii CBS 2104]|uniref:WGS project CCBQ000000000 data, contig 00015 n=1 Tax=Kluyveromyces dobzhanskii CBS 2104 TaxID=1427455 RepID=A0A0A8LB71_9SACH|nr:unnamed protein product [Kluyveromyces dobzhanskii CBS 2104]
MDLESYEVSGFVLEARALPTLTTATTEATSDETTKQTSTATDDETTDTDTSTSSGKSTSSKTTSKTGLLSTLTTGTSTSDATSSESTSSYTTPAIELPSAQGNPNIWSSNKPAGTVFIAVGAVAGFILLAVAVWFFINSWMSYSHAKQLKKFNNMEKQFQNPFIDDIDFPSGSGYYKADEDANTYYDDPVRSKNGQKTTLSPYKRASHSMIRLLGTSTDELGISGESPMPGGNNNINPLERADAIDAANMDLRKSLYISPTMEFMNQQRKSMLFSNMNQSAISIDTPEMREPTRTASPERRTYQHEKSKNSLSKLVDSTIDLTATTTLDNQKRQGRSKEHKKTPSITPSMFLDNMLEDGDS